MCQGKAIRAADLGLQAGAEAAARVDDMSLEEVEAFLIKKALAATKATPAKPPKPSD
jgi:hypothetical protein